MYKKAVSHEELKERWSNMIAEDPETYNSDFLAGYQNNKLRQFLKEEAEAQGAQFDPVQVVKKFNEELKLFPDEVEPISEGDHLKSQFCREPGHENWKKVVEE